NVGDGNAGVGVAGVLGLRDPVRVFREKERAGADAVERDVVDVGGQPPFLLELPGSLEDDAADGDYHAVRRAEVLLRAVVDRLDAVLITHQLSHRSVLEVAGEGN